AIYQIKGLTEEDEKLYRDMYRAACDSWLDENIFATHRKEDTNKAEMLVRFAKQLGVNSTDAFQAFEGLQQSKVDVRQFEAKLAELADRALNSRMLEQFERLYLRMEAKHNRH
ncbi:MAG: hypothetical protein O2V44_10555, partial [Candidatus Bathyarchaeota archaeon]|nr:hypothetical protein [Candidatus Bathyarchaeota archaeon]